VPAFRESLNRCLEKEREAGLSEREMAFVHVFAPSICAYVMYVLEDAKKRGKKELFFLARDAYLFYKAAEIIGAVMTPDIKLTYLSVSRYSLRSAEYFLGGSECLDTICSGAMDITFAKIMQRVGLTSEERSEISAKTGFSGREDMVLNFRELKGLKKKLDEVPEFMEYVKPHAEDKYQVTIDYLKQHGLDKERAEEIAIVDSGWIGSIQKTMGRLIQIENLEGYYFGLFDLPADVNASNYHTFYISPNESDAYRRIRFSICLFETVCSEPTGMTVGYEYDSSRMAVPVLSGIGNPNSESIERFAELICEYAVILSKSGALDRTDNDRSVRMCEDLLSHCMSDPTDIEADTFGKMLFSDDVLEGEMKPLCTEWNEEDLKNNLCMNRILAKCGLRKANIPESGWPEGSIVNACRGDRHKAEHYLISERRFKKLAEAGKKRIKRGR
jgi:hypothetical protein